jgi:hypothetical protein
MRLILNIDLDADGERAGAILTGMRELVDAALGLIPISAVATVHEESARDRWAAALLGVLAEADADGEPSVGFDAEVYVFEASPQTKTLRQVVAELASGS